MLDRNFSAKVLRISTVFGGFCGHWRFAITDFTSSCKEIDSKKAGSHTHNVGEKTECCHSHEHGWNTLNYSISFTLIVIE